MRAGASALSLLSAPLNAHILTALEQGQHSLVDLRKTVGSPPSTTLRMHLRNLAKLEVLEHHQEPGFPGAVAYRLARPGVELGAVAKVVDCWLAAAPSGPLSLGEAGSKSALKALIEGWSTSIVRALAAHSLALTQLSRLISALSYPSLERRLAAMKLAGQIAACQGRGRGTPYAVTDWLRQGTAPLAAAARWEQRYMPDTPPFSPLDVEAFFLLALPLVELDAQASGSCRLAVDFGATDGNHRVAGAIVTFRDGRFVSCMSRLGEAADAWVSGSVTALLDTVVAGEAQRIEIGGDSRLAAEIIEALQGTLFGSSRRGRKMVALPPSASLSHANSLP